MAKVSIGKGALLAPLPDVMVSCGDISGEKNIITVGWTGMINTTPPMCYISVMPSRYSHDIIAESREFVINLVSEKLTRAMDLCGVKSGRDIDKFRLTGLTPQKCSCVNCPAIAESPVSIECRVIDTVPLPSHDMFLAEIVNVTVDERLIDEAGKVRFESAGLVAGVHGGYYPVSSRQAGSFGYSVMKPKTRKRKEKEKAAARRAAAGKRKRR